MTSEKDTFSMFVTLHADENPELFKRLVSITNKQRRSRELKRLATNGLLEFTQNSSTESGFTTQEKRHTRITNIFSSQTNKSTQPSDVLLLPIIDSLDDLSM